MIWKNNSLADLKKMYLDDLKLQFDESEALQMLNILILHFFKLSRSQQAINHEHRLNESEMLSLHNAVKDLKANKPVQYITGESEFRDMKFLINNSVLIPRPETEELVELIIKNEEQEGIKVLDVGTGSGCIAISLAGEMNNAVVFAIDVSADALKVAEKNAKLNKVKVKFLEEDILSPSQIIEGQFDVIVSNPPYVTIAEKNLMKANVLEFEPHLALFVENENPLEFYKAILNFSDGKLKNGGRVYFEINEKLGSKISQLLNSYGFSNIKITSDLNDRDRIVSAVKANE